MFDTILFATNASPTCDDAADVAFDLAKKYKSKLEIFHVLGVPTRGFSHFSIDPKTGDKEFINEEHLAKVRGGLGRAYQDRIEYCRDCEVDVAWGQPHTEILRKARKDDVDLVVLGAHTRDEDQDARRHRWVVGNTMRKVAKGSRCPVLIINRPCENCWGYFSNIVLGVDFSKASVSAYKFAANLAKQIGTYLHVFHAVDLTPGPAGKPRLQAEVEDAIAAAKQKIAEVYPPLVPDFDNYQIEVWEGIPYVEILKFTREKHGDLIVMAHHAKEGATEEAEIGSTVEQVVLRASCPVISINRPHKAEV